MGFDKKKAPNNFDKKLIPFENRMNINKTEIKTKQMKGNGMKMPWWINSNFLCVLGIK